MQPSTHLSRKLLLVLRDRYLNYFSAFLSMGFPDSSVGKESTCSAGDPGSIPRVGRSTGEGIRCPFRVSVFLVWESARIGVHKKLLLKISIYLKAHSASFSRAQSASFLISTLNSFQESVKG